MKSKKSGFTLVEVMISIVIISIIAVMLSKFYSNFDKRMHDMDNRSQLINEEYQDILIVRTTNKTESPLVIKDKLNYKDNLQLVEKSTKREVWLYEGKYIQTHKMFE